MNSDSGKKLKIKEESTTDNNIVFLIDEKESTNNEMSIFENVSLSSCNFKKRIRKYNESFLLCGFYFKLENFVQLPYCLICKKTFKNSSMEKSKLNNHYTNQHSDVTNMMPTNEFFIDLLKKK